jgi:hypothetical protein
MKLSEAQAKFALAVAHLIIKINEMGCSVTLGEAYRPPQTAEFYAKQGKGIIKSLHIQKLAIDLNLFKGDEYLAKTEDHKQVGLWWEEYGILNNMPLRWGGRFGDGNHYSYEWEGVK